MSFHIKSNYRSHTKLKKTNKLEKERTGKTNNKKGEKTEKYNRVKRLALGEETKEKKVS